MRSNTTVVLQGQILDESIFHDVDELCRYAMVSIDELMQMVDEGILEPMGHTPAQWRFNYRDFMRTRIIAHLQHDLGVNLAGAAIIINLLEK